MVEVRMIFRNALVFAAAVALLSACTRSQSSPAKINACSLNTFCETSESDAEMDSIIDVRRAEMLDYMSIEIGTTDTFMIAERPESDLMRLLSTALLETAQKISRERDLPMPIMSLMNFGGIRTTMPQGKITIRNIFEISPFENQIVILTCSGSIIKAMMEHVAEQGGEAISGATMTFRDHKMIEAKIAGEEIDESKTYVIAANNYVAEGGDGFLMLCQCQRFDTNIMIREMLIDYIKETTARGQHVIAPTDVRITKLDDNE